MPPPDDAQRPPAEETEGRADVTGGRRGNRTTRASSRCMCNLCLDGVRPKLTMPAQPDLDEVARRSCVTAGYPCDWWSCVVLGLDPLTGEELAA